jgi:hypothetical protein
MAVAMCGVERPHRGGIVRGTMQDTRTGRIFGFVFLLAVAGAVVLLIAGLGVPVGVGALVGLILGFVAGMLGFLWALRGAGRSVSVAGFGWAARTPPPTEDELAEIRDLTEVQQIDLGPIRVVRPALQTVEVGGLAVQLVEVEEREAGMTLGLDVRVGVGARPPGHMARVAVSDDLGTAYRASAVNQGGSAGHLRFEVAIIPALPPAATRLDLRVERFVAPFDRAAADQAGPWAFSVAIGPAGPDQATAWIRPT